jgi:hypothetical protein
MRLLRPARRNIRLEWYKKKEKLGLKLQKKLTKKKKVNECWKVLLK